MSAAAIRLLGGTVATATPMHGGDLSAVALIRFTDGRQVVMKSGPAPRTEAAMLKALSAAGVPTPSVLAVDDAALALTHIKAAGRLTDAWQDLGAWLARLHAATGPSYGWAENYAFGQVIIENGWSDNWPDFYAQRRLLTHLPTLPTDLARRIETLARGIANRLPHQPPAALLHGDLWGGNVMVADNMLAAFIDPACIYGHAEMDIAMLGLFDRPTQAFFRAYSQLVPGLSERLVIYRLWPALVHLRLFGEGYRGMVEGLLQRAGA